MRMPTRNHKIAKSNKMDVEKHAINIRGIRLEMIFFSFFTIRANKKGLIGIGYNVKGHQ